MSNVIATPHDESFSNLKIGCFEYRAFSRKFIYRWVKNQSD